MVLRMSISSVPGTNSVFFASLPIDYLPIDKVWEKIRGFDTPVKSRGRRQAYSRTRGDRRSRYLQTRRLSSAKRDRRRIIGERAHHRQDGIFGTDRARCQIFKAQESLKGLVYNCLAIWKAVAIGACL